MNPYFYKIQHKPTGKIYIGSQYGKNSDSKNLLNDYFTSSKSVKRLMEQDGTESFVILLIDERLDAREYEQKYLLETYYEIGRDRFLNEYLNRNLSPGILLTKDIIDKANKKRKVSNSLSAKKLLEEGRHNFQINKGITLDHVKKLRSQRMIGNKLGSLRKITDELKNKLSEKSKGNTNVRDTKWWNNGEQRRRSKTSPGEGWKEGFQINGC